MTKILPFLLLLVFVSCQKNVDPIFIYDVEDEFELSLHQSTGNTHNIVVHISTTQEMPDNYKIEAFAKIINGHVELNIYQILKPSTDSETKAILSTAVVIDSLGNGLHDLSLIIRETIINEGVLTVSDDKITLDFSEPKGIKQSHLEANRFPSDAFWGVVYVDSSYHEGLLDIFLDSLDLFATDVLNPLVGNYGYFSIADDASLELNVSTSPYERYFYMTTSEFSRINQKVQDFKAYEAGFQAHVVTARGDIFYNVGPGDDLGLYKISDTIQ